MLIQTHKRRLAEGLVLRKSPGYVASIVGAN